MPSGRVFSVKYAGNCKTKALEPEKEAERKIQTKAVPKAINQTACFLFAIFHDKI